MKYVLLFLSLFLFVSCTVNEYTGSIKITNELDYIVQEVKLNDTILAWNLQPNEEREYWFYGDMEGKLYVSDFDSTYEYKKKSDKPHIYGWDAKRTNKVNFKISYRSSITIEYDYFENHKKRVNIRENW